MIRVACTRKLALENRKFAKQQGLNISDCDLISIQYLSNNKLAHDISQNQSCLIFTSQHAIKAYLNLIQEFDIAQATRKVAVISGTSKDLALQNGFDIIAEAPDSKRLAEELVKLEFRRYLHLTSNLRLDSWKSLVEIAGISIDAIELYHKKITEYQFSEFQAVLFFSPSQVDAFFKSNRLPKDIPAFCIGNTTAETLRMYQHPRRICSVLPKEKEILNTVIDYFKGK